MAPTNTNVNVTSDLDELHMAILLAANRVSDALRVLKAARNETCEAEAELKAAQQRGWNAGLELQAASREWRRLCAAFEKLLPAP